MAGVVRFALVPLHPVPEPPVLIVGRAGTRQRLPRAGQVVEITGFHCLADETINQILLGLALPEPREQRDSAEAGRANRAFACLGDGESVASDGP